MSTDKLVKLCLILPAGIFSAVLLLSWSFYGEIFISFFPYLIAIYCIYMLLLSVFLFLLRIDLKKQNILWINWLVVFFAFLSIFSNYFELSASAADNYLKNEIKVVGVNLWYKNTQTNLMTDFFNDEDPDILMLAEFTDVQYEEMREYLSNKFPYSTLQIDGLSRPYTGKAIFSQFPLDKKVIEDPINSEIFLFAQTKAYNKNIDLLMVHTTAPVNTEFFDSRNEQLSFLGNELIGEIEEPAIVMGDFNTSPWTPRFIKMDNQLSDQDFSRIRNNSFVFSWQYQGFPRLKSHIDHTYLTTELSKKSYELKDFPGSDHKAQVLTISVD
jgi:endonuclease/exonuclease/phosphatase (EEP) superfamily protein YafD